jgi:indole-3-glycerol phosphate synthase
VHIRARQDLASSLSELFLMAFVCGQSLPALRRRTPLPGSVCGARGPVMLAGTSDVPDVLRSILDRKKTEVENLRAVVEKAGAEHPIARLLAKKGSIERRRLFESALTLPKGTMTVIAEIKRRSPSKGHIADIKDPTMYGRTYYEGGAAAISVLTDEEGFGGTIRDLESVAKHQQRYKGNFPGPCPVLRKDFIIDEIQIAEASVAGAGAVLLIMSALGQEKCKALLDTTHALGLDALVEVHDKEELEMALATGAKIIGVNNRNLHTFEVSLETSLQLAPHIPESVIKVSESGIEDCTDAWRLRDAGYSAVLVGETLVKAFEESQADSTSYTIGYNQAKGLIKAFKAKGSVKYGPKSAAAFYGKGEGASEMLGEISI